MVSFKLFAGTHIGLRDNNEDNFSVCPDLTKEDWISPIDNNNVISLGAKGCLMVVADGMGGQNAGEVASAIAIDTVREMFSSMSDNVIKKDESIIAFLKKVIIEADIRVKNHSKKDPSTSGMGSTIIIAWVLQGSVYIAWLGDSRAYSYIPKKGIGRLSKDHSYVQQLVDAGTISDDDAMIHPNSNIITRSLGDFSQKAKPDVIKYPISEGEIILLCTDGLCGVCRDEEIGGIIEEYHNNLQLCKERLTLSALSAGGSDNITIALLEVVQMDDIVSIANDQPKEAAKSVSQTSILALIAIVLLIIVCLICLLPINSESNIKNDPETIDTTTSTFPTYTPGEGSSQSDRRDDTFEAKDETSDDTAKFITRDLTLNDLSNTAGESDTSAVTLSTADGQSVINSINTD